MQDLPIATNPTEPRDTIVCPFLTAEVPGIGGILKQQPEDFVVEEIPAYELSGEGEHLFVWIEKRDIAGDMLVRHVAAALEISRNEIGVAGLKDRRAITRQYLSVPARCEDRIPAIDTDAIKTFHVKRHGNKLKTGHLKGNRFSILVRDCLPNAFPNAQQIGERIQSQGFPNYFGSQRFGIAGETLSLGLDLLRGRKKPHNIPRSNRRFLLRFALSAVQSSLFNATLTTRMKMGFLHRVLEGDVMQVSASGGKFIVTDTEAEQQRFDDHETVITGPMFGPKMKRPSGEPAAFEQQSLEECELSEEDFKRYRKLTSGTRRPYLVHPEELAILSEADGIRFQFTLPSGSYATTLLREFRKTDELT